MIKFIIVVFLVTLTKSENQIGRQHIFSCDQRPSGYYADVETGCQVYHMCDGLGRQFSYTCPNNTLFQQRMLICDHWYMVNCNKSEVDYTANLLIGQRDKPFVEDSDKHPYYRTPRPDLLNTTDYNYIFKNGKSELTSNYNLVGVETDQSEESFSSNIKTHYSLPSHWFTSIYADSTTQSSNPYKIVNYDENFIEKRPLIKDTKNAIKRQYEPKEPQIKRFFNEIAKSRNAPEQRSNDDLDLELEPNTTTTIIKTTVTPRSQTKYTIDDEEWKNIKEMFLVPDYEFPLENATRPGYDNGKSSFDTSSLS